jgi:hypothetical protein
VIEPPVPSGERQLSPRSEMRWSETKVLRLSNGVYFETASSSARAWSSSSYAYVAISAMVIASPMRASDS